MKLENAVGAVAVLLAIGAVPAATAAEIPRLPNGKPDFSGNYNAATLTPLTRPAELGNRLTLTDEEAAAIAKRKADLYAADSAPSDPDRGAPPVGGTPIFDPGLEVASGGSGGYNAFYMDPGEGAFKIDGKWRTSILVDPADGQLPALTPAAQQRQAVAAKLLRANVETGEAWWIGDDSGGPYDDMEQRPHAERCLLGFGSTAGPPMLPTLYNSMKTIVHTEDHLMILIEMAHDARIIRIGGEHLPSTIKTWLGDSIAKWEGDTLVVETTNQRNGFRQFGHKLADAPEGMRIVERFSYLNPETLLYQFTVSEPSSFTAPFSGEYVWPASDDRVYEYACHEGNYALGNIMRGARMLEADTRPAGESGR